MVRSLGFRALFRELKLGNQGRGLREWMYGIGTHGISLVRVIWGFQRSTIEVVDLEKKLESPDPGSLSLSLTHVLLLFLYFVMLACLALQECKTLFNVSHSPAESRIPQKVHIYPTMELGSRSYGLLGIDSTPVVCVVSLGTPVFRLQHPQVEVPCLGELN